MEFSPKKATTTNKCCSVPQCSSLAERDRTLSFHTFPKETETVRVSDIFGNYAATGRRKEWARVLKIGKPVSKCMYVCSKHFTAENFRFPDIPAQKRYLKYDAVPSKNLPQLPGRGRGQTTTRHLDRRRKILQENSLADVPQCPLKYEDNEPCDPELSLAASEERQVSVKVEQQVAVKVELPDDEGRPPVVFIKTEVTDDSGCRPSTGLDLLLSSSYSAAINLGRDGAEDKMDASRPDFRFVDVGRTVPSTSGRATDVDPLELSSASLPEPTIKQEQPDYTEEDPLVQMPQSTPTGGLGEQTPKYREIRSSDPIIPHASGSELVDADESYYPTVCEGTSTDPDQKTGIHGVAN